MYSTILTINGTIAQSQTGSTINDPTHSSIYCEGGWRSVDAFGDLSSIPDNHLLDGMGVFVIGTQSLYVYDEGTTSWYKPTIIGDLDLTGAQAGEVLIYNESWGAGVVSGSGISDNAITRHKIADHAITSDKIALSGILEDNIDYGAVTSIHINDGAVLSGKLDPDFEASLSKFVDDSPETPTSTIPDGHYFAVSGDGASEAYLYVSTGENEWKRVALTSFP